MKVNRTGTGRLVPVAIALISLSALSACGTPASSSSTRVAVTPMALAGDEQAAARLVQPCVSAASLTSAKACVEGKVPAAKRTALKQCLANVLADVPGVHPSADRAAFEAGAQSCVVKVLP